MATPFGLTEDGFETQLATNHLGHFLFINRIAPLIRDGGRVVALASSGHRYGPPDLEDPNFERAPYNPRSEEHTSELQSLMRISYAVFCLKTKTQQTTTPQ